MGMLGQRRRQYRSDRSGQDGGRQLSPPSYLGGKTGGHMSERAEFHLHGRELLAEPFHYTASGLNNIYLMNGVVVETTPYGDEVTIENLKGLHRAIGLHIVEKAKAMTGPELRFLRKQMNLTQAELARELRISDQTIANYEKGKTEIGPVDRFMRGYYLLSILPNETRVTVLKDALTRYRARKRRILPDIPRNNIVMNWNECAQNAA
jgi:DNA-binding transcriptional regulator YiaG